MAFSINVFIFLLFFLNILLIHLLLVIIMIIFFNFAALGLPWSTWTFSSCGEWALECMGSVAAAPWHVGS